MNSGAPSCQPERHPDSCELPLESYALVVNGHIEDVCDSWIGENLLYVLRERLGHYGSKNACEQGQCGSCSILLDGKLVAACCILAADAVDARITTIEGVTQGVTPKGTLGDIQQAFVDAGAVQCGFCTPGMVMALTAILERTPEASEQQVREELAGNLCRCTGYGRILAAVDQVQTKRRLDLRDDGPAGTAVQEGPVVPAASEPEGGLDA